MKPFAFRLERLLDVRRVREEIARREFAAARAASEAQAAKLAALREEEEGARERRRALRQATLDVARLGLEDQALAALARTIRREEARRDDLARELEARRGALDRAHRAVRVLERFREKQVRAGRAAAARREQKVLDEVAQNGRRRMDEAS